MYTKQLIRRAFGSGQGKSFFTFASSLSIVSHKFPENTVAGLYKRAVAENHYHDAVRFGAQRINWTLKEFDVSTLISLSIPIC